MSDTSAQTEVTAGLLRGMPLPQPAPGGKDERGRILIVAGSAEVAGAAILAATAAYRAGAGRVRIGTVARAALHVAAAVPEAMVLALEETVAGGIDVASNLDLLREQTSRCHALLLGPGVSAEAATARLGVDLCNGMPAPVILDAAALSALKEADFRRPDGALIVTPHAGEMARLLDLPRENIERDPLDAARQASDRWQCIVVLKGARTHIVEPGGRTWLFAGGSVGLATSGSGDVLAGIMAALLGRGCNPVEAALWGVFLHGEAGRRLAEHIGPLGFLAREIAGEVPRIMRDFAQATRGT